MTRSKNAQDLIRKLVISVFLASALFQSLPSLAHGDRDQLRADMKQMNWNLRRAVKADTPEELSDYLKQIQTHAENARREGHHHDSELFNEGLDEVLSKINVIQSLISDGDMNTAKSELKDLNKLKKKYHKKLDV